MEILSSLVGLCGQGLESLNGFVVAFISSELLHGSELRVFNRVRRRRKAQRGGEDETRKA